MPEHELWLTKLFNDYLPAAGNAALTLVGKAPEARPWANFVIMQFVVAAIIIVVFALLRSRLNSENPGKLQHTFELVHNFLSEQASEQVGHHGSHYVAYFGTLFIFILFGNLLGVIPGFESPTMFPAVTLGCAATAFLYYNIAGVKANGAGKYLAHFAGPLPLLSPLMIPIEIVSHLARPLSLTVRLYANMYAGEQVTIAFLGLTYFLVPAIFMGLHVFVSLLQAYIFVLMTMIYVAGATAHDH